MSQVRPFRAIRRTPQAAARVASVPYDVVEGKDGMAAGH